MSNNHNHYNINPLEYVTTDIFDLITVNGRISKKLVEKVIIPKIDRYYESLQEITLLKKALKIADEAIGFYELHNNWLGINEANPFNLSGLKWIRIVEDDAFYDDKNREYRGGKRAREALKQIEEVMEGK